MIKGSASVVDLPIENPRGSMDLPRESGIRAGAIFMSMKVMKAARSVRKGGMRMLT